MRKILVMSGKGGVGKTTVAVNLAVKLSEKNKVGLLDIDIHGPNVPKMLGLEGTEIRGENGKMLPAEYSPSLKAISIGFMLKDQNAPVIWRGPLKHKAITQFVNDVEWGDLDYFVVDLPPGTGDESMSIAELIPEAEAVIVSTPQEVALLDVRKTIGFARKLNIRIIGLIENMSGGVFGTGKVEKLAKEEGIPFLGTIPLDGSIARASDSGKPFVLSGADGGFGKIAEKIALYKPPHL